MLHRIQGTRKAVAAAANAGLRERSHLRISPLDDTSTSTECNREGAPGRAGATVSSRACSQQRPAAKCHQTQGAHPIGRLLVAPRQWRCSRENNAASGSALAKVGRRRIASVDARCTHHLGNEATGGRSPSPTLARACSPCPLAVSPTGRERSRAPSQRPSRIRRLGANIKTPKSRANASIEPNAVSRRRENREKKRGPKERSGGYR
eukprot:6181524-Pleurochrysis_carterae.AAC.3